MTSRKTNCDPSLSMNSTQVANAHANCCDCRSVPPSNSSDPPVRITLVELVITVAVLGILAAIALPSYQSYVKRANRSSAQSLMLDLQIASSSICWITDRSLAAGLRSHHIATERRSSEVSISIHDDHRHG